MNSFDLSGRVAVVTGGNGGIGFGMARGLAKAGASIAIVGRDAAKSEKAVADLDALGARCVQVQADVT
ncbi:MAG: SDR family NAD(P)-dependent oxidoreductase, partial [Gammaproteobacteria bacterium]